MAPAVSPDQPATLIVVHKLEYQRDLQAQPERHLNRAMSPSGFCGSRPHFEEASTLCADWLELYTAVIAIVAGGRVRTQLHEQRGVLEATMQSSDVQGGAPRFVACVYVRTRFDVLDRRLYTFLVKK